MSEEPASRQAARAPASLPDLEDDVLVRELRPQPTEPPLGVVHVTGYLGRDSAVGYWRIYGSERLDSYVRVAESEILSRSLELGPDGREVSRVVIRATAPVEAVRSMMASQASFLLGTYTSSLLGSDPTSPAGPRRAPLRRTPAEELAYPMTGYPYICPVQITIEFQTCFCTIFCQTMPAE